MRAAYLWIWREPDDGTYEPLIIANLKFATFNVCLAIVVVLIALVLRVT